MVSFGFQFFCFSGFASDNREKWRKTVLFSGFLCFEFDLGNSGSFFLFKLLFSRNQVRHGVRHVRAHAKQLVVDSRDLVRRPSLRDAYDGSFGDSSFHG